MSKKYLKLSMLTRLSQLRRAVEVASTQLVVTQLHTGRLDSAAANLEVLLEPTVPLLDRNRAHATALASWLAAWQGDMPRAQGLFDEAKELRLPLGWHDSYMGAGYRVAGALLCLEKGNYDAVADHVDALSEHESTIEHWPFLTHISTLIIECRLGSNEALSFLTQQLARRGRRASPLPFPARELEILRMRLAWQSGQLLPARKGEQDAGAVYAALSRGENTAALGLALGGVQNQSYAGSPHSRAELLLLQAESARRLGELDIASEAAKRASSLMSDYGLTLPMRTLPSDSTEALAKLVPDLPVGHSSQGITRFVKPLTPSELRALTAVVESGSVPGAAEKLFLSSNTVKAHMRRVYRKLGVYNRTDAIRAASEAGLINIPPGDS